LREDAGFHAYQMLEAGVQQFSQWGAGNQSRHILIAVARYLAAHFPTARAHLQTADIARRLMRGAELHREMQVCELSPAGKARGRELDSSRTRGVARSRCAMLRSDVRWRRWENLGHCDERFLKGGREPR
jgi:hypothetical protein